MGANCERAQGRKAIARKGVGYFVRRITNDALLEAAGGHRG